MEIVKELQSESVAYVRSLPVEMTGRPDGIDKVQEFKSSRVQEGAIYDLQGRRLQKAPQKGIYIQDGKKRVYIQ